ncbi:MAG: hypothetical protein KDD47_14815, partial [Acidobacteria bacterium]|nr:hypothetical protein [Acidobacteriota bacterium]
AVAILLQKAAGVAPGEFPTVRCLQVGIIEVGESPPAKCRLARLARAGHAENRVLPKECLSGPFERSTNNHTWTLAGKNAICKCYLQIAKLVREKKAARLERR